MSLREHIEELQRLIEDHGSRSEEVRDYVRTHRDVEDKLVDFAALLILAHEAEVSGSG